MSRVSRHPPSRRWTLGADGVEQAAPGDGAYRPSGRLHAVSAAGLLEGRAVCLAPVTLLDPAHWVWPDDADEERPLCWICLAITHSTEWERAQSSAD